MNEKVEVSARENVKSNPVFEDAGLAPAYARVELARFIPNSDSYFDGTLLELLGHKSLATVITVLTGTIGKPWGDCIVKKYIYSHTVYNGKRLKFEGDPVDLFVQRFKWNFFRVITFGIYSFWVPVRYKQWELSNVRFEDEPYERYSSYFTGTVLGYLGIRILAFLITIFTFGLLKPVAHCIKLNWELDHSVINRKPIDFRGNPFGLLLKKLLWWLLSLVTFGIYGLWINLNTLKWEASNTYIKRRDDVTKKVKKETSPVFAIVGLVIVLILAIILIAKVSIIFKDSDPADEEVIQNAITEVKNEMYTKNIYDVYNGQSESGFPKKAKKLNINAINNFINQGGKAYYTGMYITNYDPDELRFELTMIKGSTICRAVIYSTPTTYDWRTCGALKDYVLPNGNRKDSQVLSEDIYQYDY